MLILKACAYTLLVIVLLFLIYVAGLTVYYFIKTFKKVLKEDRDHDRDRKP